MSCVRKLLVEQVCGVLSLRTAAAFGSWACALTGEIQMKIVHVKACIDALKAIRDSKHQEISTSIKEELEAVIQELERCCEQSEGDIQISVAQRSRALEIISKVLEAATNLNSLVRAFIDYL
jgi:hypothetical protein